MQDVSSSRIHSRCSTGHNEQEWLKFGISVLGVFISAIWIAAMNNMQQDGRNVGIALAATFVAVSFVSAGVHGCRGMGYNPI